MTTPADASMNNNSLIMTSKKLQESLALLVRVIDANHRFLVVSHIGPDGDAVGSTLAMGLLLEQLGKEVVVYNRDAIPYNFLFLPGASNWRTSLQGEAAFDVTIVLDCAEPGRVGTPLPENGWGQTVVVIDHHKTWDKEFADVYVRDPQAAATGELVFHVVQACGELTTEIAQNLYCCMLTDTGSFRYSNTTQAAFRVAGELVQAGVDPWYMTSHIYENQPKSRLELLCRVLGTLDVSSCGRLAFLRVEDDMLEGLDESTPGMTDGFINYARSIQGVEVATQLRQMSDNYWKISFRSRGKVDVSDLAARFGGGGHFNAAGCQIQGSPTDIQEQLTTALNTILDQ